jgi:hypothetical protein
VFEKSRERKSKPWLKYYSAPISKKNTCNSKEENKQQTELAKDVGVRPQQISKIVKWTRKLIS